LTELASRRIRLSLLGLIRLTCAAPSREMPLNKEAPVGKNGSSFRNIGLRLAAGVLFALSIYFLETSMIKSGASAINANANELAAISRDCNDLAARNSRDLNEKNQLGAQCMRDRMASLGKKPSP
jgi:hypothetical protein